MANTIVMTVFFLKPKTMQEPEKNYRELATVPKEKNVGIVVKNNLPRPEMVVWDDCSDLPKKPFRWTFLNKLRLRYYLWNLKRGIQHGIKNKFIAHHVRLRFYGDDNKEENLRNAYLIYELCKFVQEAGWIIINGNDTIIRRDLTPEEFLNHYVPRIRSQRLAHGYDTYGFIISLNPNEYKND